MSTPTRRLFFALWPDDTTRQALFHWQTHNLPADVRWLHRADLHMTLHFLGQVDASLLDPLLELGADQDAKRFALVLDKIGHWRKPQILWVGPSSVPGELPQLHERLGAGLNVLGIETEARAFKPHVTLARKVRKQPPLQPLSPLTWPAAELALVESRPGDAPMYQPVGRWPL
jgi:2'-5' RNA ligase